MFSIKGFYVLASGAIQGHHGSIVLDSAIQGRGKYDNVKHLPVVFLFFFNRGYLYATISEPRMFRKFHTRFKLRCGPNCSVQAVGY